MSNGNFTIEIIDTNTNIGTNYIVNGSDLIDFNTFNSSAYTSDIITYFSGSYIAELIRDNTDLYQTLKFYDETDGSLLQTITLTGDSYNNY
jgi:hypothetical protein